MRNCATKEIDAPPEMWHLDTNLLKVDLDLLDD